ncbi:MAG: hypothetical protein ACE5E2_05580, partial [Candidatus Binatia bacterium]
MAKKSFSSLDFSKVRTYPLKKRLSKVKQAHLGKTFRKGSRLRSFIDGLPDVLAAQNLKEIKQRIAHAYKRKKTILLGMGAHPIKVGLSPLIIDFMKRGV